MGDRSELELLRLSLFDTRPLVRGREVRLAVLSGPQGGEYEARVEGADSHHLYLSAPQRQGVPVHPVPGTPVTVTIRSHLGTYHFASQLASRGSDAPDLLAVVLPPEAQRLQRRRHLRTAVELPITVGRLPGKGEPPAAVRFVAGRTGNLSEGGLWFTCPLRLGEGDLVSISLAVPGARRRLRATCEVLRTEAEAGAAAARFVDLDERMAAELVAFLERRRRERRGRLRAAMIVAGRGEGAGEGPDG